MKNDKLQDALLKKALGFKEQEESEEYAIVDGELKLVKRKTATKIYPPDLSALQLLIDKKQITNDTKYSNMTLEQLQAEKLRLIKLLQKEEK